MVLLPILKKRKCDGCTACCRTHYVKSIDKLPGVWCEHCNQGSGCAIYSTRPKGYQVFKCEWLKGFGQVSDRPDRSGVVVDWYFLDALKADLQSLWEFVEGSLEHEFAIRTLGDLLKQDQLVMQVYISGRAVLHVPKTLDILPATRALLEGDGTEIVLH